MTTRSHAEQGTQSLGRPMENAGSVQSIWYLTDPPLLESGGQAIGNTDAETIARYWNNLNERIIRQKQLIARIRKISLHNH